MHSTLPHYLVVGGGISGLSTAYLVSLIKSLGSYRLTLVDSADRWGGWIQTIRNADTGAQYELGPHSARTTSPTSKLFSRLVASLNLSNSLMYLRYGSKSARRFIYVKGRLLPVSFFGFSTQYPFTRSPNAMLLRKLLSRHPQLVDDCTVDEFFRSRFDSEFADYYGSAIVRGIFAGDSRKLSVQACFPQFVEMEKLGPIGGLARFLFGPPNQNLPIPNVVDKVLPIIDDNTLRQSFAWSLPTGMQTITNAMVDKLKVLSPHINMRRNTKVSKLLLMNGKFKVMDENENDILPENEFFDTVFLACPSFESRRILSDILPTKTLERLNMDSLPWENIACAVLEIRDATLTNAQGFGHLVPSLEDQNILGVIYDSIAFPALDGFKGGKRYTVMMKAYPDWLDNSKSPHSVKQDITKKACTVLKTHLNISNLDLIGHYSEVLRNCIPQYPIGHLSNIANLRTELSEVIKNQGIHTNIHLLGNSYDGVGLGDSVYSVVQAVGREFQL